MPFVEKLDFSEFHDLFHPILSRKCKNSYPFGWRKSSIYHIKLLWEYKYSHYLLQYTLCKIGFHHSVLNYQCGRKWKACLYCDKQLSPDSPCSEEIFFNGRVLNTD